MPSGSHLTRARVVAERLGFGVVAAVAAAVVLRWAGTPWRTSLLAGSAVLVVVPVAAWLASTVPGPPPAPGDPDRRDDRDRHRRHR